MKVKQLLLLIIIEKHINFWYAKFRVYIFDWSRV
jgi:hypothetical protein